MATPTIPNGEEYFFPIIYEGNGGGQRVGKFVPFTDSGTIDNSCIFNKADSPYLEKTYSGNGSRTTWTISFWVKLGTIPSYNATRGNLLIAYNTSSGAQEDFRLEGSNQQLQWYTHNDGGTGTLADLKTTRTFEDTSKWYHMMFVADRTNATAADRQIIYIDGERVTAYATESYPSQSAEGHIGKSADVHYIGSRAGNSNTRFDGYLAEFNYVDGTALTPSTFGVTDTSTGRWIPKTLSGITYGTNGFRLKFQDSSALGDDTSGNTNDFTANNLASTDQTTDSPTQNFATFDSNRNGGDWTLSEGNLKIVGTPSTGAGRICLSGMNIPNSNKIYWEVEVDVNNDSPRLLGIFRDTVSLTAGSSTEDMRYIAIRNGGTQDGKVWDGTSTSSQLTTTTSGDIIQFARDGEKLWIGKNNTWLNSGNPSTGANPLLTNIDTNSNWKMGVWSVSAGLPSGTSHTFIANTGQRSFTYTPPTGFVALQQDNLPETAKGVSGLVWVKNRDQASNSHGLIDSSRGASKNVFSNSTSAEQDYDGRGLTKFLKGGYSCGEYQYINGSGDSLVSWNWVANGGTTASNTDGSITSTVQANTTAGFSIVQYTGTGSAGTIGHGLSSAPEWVIVKSISNDTGDTFSVYHVGMTSASYYLRLGGTNAETNASVVWNATAPTSSVFSVGTATGTNTNTYTYLAYCWHGVDGFSKFGKYTANGNADGPFVYTGFRPAFTMIKNINSTYGWIMEDSKRNPFNPIDNYLYANATDAEASTDHIDFLSNGFKIRFGTGSAVNNGTDTYIYIAFAEHPFVGDGTNPVTAR